MSPGGVGVPSRTAPPAPQHDTAAACPYCAVLIDPAPERGRLCPRCRRRIVVRRVGGRRVLLTEEAVDVFEAERERDANTHLWTTERSRWLGLAKGVSAPANRVARLASSLPSEAVVSASKELYISAADRAVKTARREKHWDEVARIRRDEAAAMHRASGSAVPPPDEVVALHREWSSAALRSHVAFGSQVELVSGGCCPVCRRDDGHAFKITAELKTQRLPHAGCPKGLCLCDWWPMPDPKTRTRHVRKRAAPRATSAAAPVGEPVADPTPAIEADATP
jgi:hypothetical protein